MRSGTTIRLIPDRAARRTREARCRPPCGRRGADLAPRTDRARRWKHVPDPPVWSIGKDAEHVAEAAVYHQWIVQRTIGQTVSPRRPAIERKTLTTTMTALQAVDLIRQRTVEGAVLISSLSDEQLALPTRPPRARAHVLADTIERVLIGH